MLDVCWTSPIITHLWSDRFYNQYFTSSQGVVSLLWWKVIARMSTHVHISPTIFQMGIAAAANWINLWLLARACALWLLRLDTTSGADSDMGSALYRWNGELGGRQFTLPANHVHMISEMLASGLRSNEICTFIFEESSQVRLLWVLSHTYYIHQ